MKNICAKTERSEGNCGDGEECDYLGGAYS